MAVNRPPAIAHRPTVAILNDIRNDLTSPAFQARVPNFTKANLQSQWQRLSEIPELRNEVISALVNRIGRVELNSIRFDNPLERFKRPAMLYGSTIEEIQVGLLKAKTYDRTRSGSEADLFGRSYHEVQSRFHTRGREEFYKYTIDEPSLRAAFLSEDGLAPFITELMSVANESDKYDEFLMMMNLLVDMYRAGGFFKIQIGDIRRAEAGSDEAKAALKAFRTAAGLLKYPSRRYNSAKMPVSAKPEDLVLFVTPEANATLDVDGLAALFNVERGQVPYQIMEVPYEYWPIPGAQAVLTTESFFVAADTYYGVGVQPNEAGRYTNYFLHHDEIISMSSFAPAILFTTEPGDVLEFALSPVTGVTGLKIMDVDGLTVTSVERGGTYQIEAEAVTDGNNDAVRYEVKGNNSSRTRVFQTNTVLIGHDESATELVFEAYAVDTENPQIKAETIVPVVGAYWKEFAPEVKVDADNDGIYEVTPKPLTVAADDTVTIPYVDGVQYKKAGVDVAPNSVHTLTAPTSFTAVAKSGYELAPGAVASWPNLAP